MSFDLEDVRRWRTRGHEEQRLLDYPADHGERGTEITGLSSGSWRERNGDYWTIQRIMESEEWRLLDYPADHGEQGRGDWTFQQIMESKDAETGLSSGSWRARTRRLDFQRIMESKDA
jgi:hypothetical protein